MYSYVFLKHTYLNEKWISDEDCCLFTGEQFNNINSNHIIIELYGKQGIRFWNEEFFLDKRLKKHPFTRQILERKNLLYFKNEKILHLIKVSHIIIFLNYSCTCIFLYSVFFFEFSKNDALQFVTLSISYIIINLKNLRKNINFLIFILSVVLKLNFLCKLKLFFILRFLNVFLFFHFSHLITMEYKNVLCFSMKYVCTILEVHKRIYIYKNENKNQKKKKDTFQF